MEMESLSQTSSTAFSQCVLSFFSGHLVFKQTLRAYSCALIVRSWAMDPRCTASIIEKEEEARQHFEELKDILPQLSPRWWKKDFKHYINKFIGEHLIEKEFVTAVPCKNEDEEEQDHIDLHGLWHLVAGAAQEWELVQQPKHAATCAKLNGALVWQGRGYVPNSVCYFLAQLSFQC